MSTFRPLWLCDKTKEARSKAEENLPGCKKIPNQQRTLNRLPTDLRCRNFANKHQLSIQIGTKRAKNMYSTCTYSNWAPIFHATIGGWECLFGEREREKLFWRGYFCPILSHLSLSLPSGFIFGSWPGLHAKLPPMSARRSSNGVGGNIRAFLRVKPTFF